MEVEIERVSTTADSVKSEGGFLSRGDAPAQAVLHANAQAMSLRKAAETQEQLGEINDRVEKTLDSYILADATEQPITGAEIVKIKDKYVKDKEATLELVDDLTQLIIILSDPIAKKKYQQQVTIFIVGYENLCGNRVKLLQQLNDFFTQNSKEDDAYDIAYPDFDIEEVGKTVRTALDRAEKAQVRLNTVSQEVVKVLETVNPKEAKSRKKKLEKAIIQSRDDIIQLTEKLASVQKELGNSEDKLSKLYKTLEGKQLEIEKLKGHVEMGKRKAQELDELRTEMEQKSATLVKARQEVDKLKLQLARAEDKHENVSNKQRESREKQQRMQSDLEEKLKEQKEKIVEIRQGMEKQHDQELRDLRNTYQRELDETRSKYQEQIDSLTAQVALIEKQRDDAEKERAELQRFTTSFFNDDTERSHSATKMSWKTSAHAVRLTSTKKSQRSLGTDSIPATPKGILKNDGTITSLKSTRSVDNTKSLPTGAQNDRSNTETVPFPGYTMTPTSKIPEDPAVQQGSSFVSSSMDAQPSMPSSPEKSMASRGKKRTGKFLKGRSTVSRTSVKPALSLQEDSSSSVVEMVDEAVQTEVIIPEKPNEEGRADDLLRRMSVIPLDVNLVKELSDMDENTNWDSFPIQEIPARFAHYRNLAKKKEEEMMEEVNELKQKYNSKVQALKGMMELRNNWNTEREELIRQLTTLQALKEEAETEAEMVVVQLEEMMADQEDMKLEIQMKTQALAEIQTLRSPIQTAVSTHEIGIGTDIKESDTEDTSKSETTTAPSFSRPATIPTIIQTDDFKRSEVILSSEPDVLTLHEEIPERIMSARARTRLVNSALSRHPVANETYSNYKNIVEFKNSISDALAKEELEYEFNLLGECEVVQMDEDNKLSVLERISDIRRSTSQILECISEIIPSLISTDDILFSNFEEPSNEQAVEEPPSTRLPSIEELQEPIPQGSVKSFSPRPLVQISDASRLLEKTDVESITSVISQESEVESKADLDASEKSEDKHKQDQGPAKTLSEPKKSVNLLSSDEGVQRKRPRKLTPREGRKKLVADYKELIQKHQQLREEFENLSRNTKQVKDTYEQQLGQNATVMQGMQDEIEKLSEQLKSFDITHPLTVKASQITSPDFMFTRLDMEHNAKALKRGLQNGRISYEGYRKMCDTMDEYVSIPIKRLARMARKYLHHTRMREVESAIRSSHSLDNKVYKLLDKMEDLQQARTTRWEQRMRHLAGEREEIAKLLVKTLEMIEHETGIFLIKPIMSVPSRKRIGSGYLISRRVKSATDDITHQQSSGILAPTSTPSLSEKARLRNVGSSSIQSSRKLDDDALKMEVKSMLSEEGGPEGVWKVQSSVSGSMQFTKTPLDLPKIVELDVNRSMFTNNNVSAKITGSEETCTGPLQSNMLSYVTVARPFGEISKRASTRYDQSSITEHGNSPPPPSPFEEQLPVYHLRKLQTPLPPIHAPQSEYEDGRSVSTYLSDADRHWSPILHRQVNEAK